MLTLVRLVQPENAPNASVQDAQEMPGKLPRDEQPENILLIVVADPVYKLDDTLVSFVHPSKV
jgi:hypothetical protein